MRKTVLDICKLIGAAIFVLSFPAYMFLPDRLLHEIATWQIIPFIFGVTALVLILLPLSAFKRLRPLIQPGFTITATLLVICLICFCPDYVDKAWGSFWVFAGFVVPVVGCTVFSLLAAIFSGDWLTLIVLMTCIVACVGSSIASDNMLGDKADASSLPEDPAPSGANEASNAIWAMLSFFLPFGLYSTIDSHWIYLIPVIVVLAVCVRKGHRWAYITYIMLACAYFWLLIDKPGILTVSPAFRTLDASEDMNRHINSFGSMLTMLLNINGLIQHTVVAYAMMMLLTPSSIRWFWLPKLEADPAGLRLDNEGSLLDEKGNMLDKDRNLEFPFEKTK
jgi:hypothetical protein